jgi:hypothetical protein
MILEILMNLLVTLAMLLHKSDEKLLEKLSHCSESRSFI